MNDERCLNLIVRSQKFLQGRLSERSCPKVKVGANVPVFVLEYLLGKYATDDQAAIEAGLRAVTLRSARTRQT